MKSSSKSHLYGPNWQGIRCEARTRKGTLCQRPGNKVNGRCKLHGGRSIGPSTEEGIARLVASKTTHGRTTKAERAKAKHRAQVGRQIKKNNILVITINTRAFHCKSVHISMFQEI